MSIRVKYDAMLWKGMMVLPWSNAQPSLGSPYQTTWTLDEEEVETDARGIRFFLMYLFIFYIFSCARSSLLHLGFLLVQQVGAALHCWLLLLLSSGSRHAGFSSCVHGLSCPAACGIFPDQGRPHVLCIGRQILYQWAFSEVPSMR